MFRISLRLVTQKHIETVSIQPIAPDTKTADWMAVGPIEAASCVSSDILIALVNQSPDMLVG